MAEGDRLSAVRRQRESMKPITMERLTGTMWLVRYPYRKTPDLYVMVKGPMVFCAQPKCDLAEFPLGDWLTHVRGHDRRRGDADVVTPAGDVIERLYEGA